MSEKQYTPSSLLAEIDGDLFKLSVSGDSVIILANARGKIKKLFDALKAQEEFDALKAKEEIDNG